MHSFRCKVSFSFGRYIQNYLEIEKLLWKYCRNLSEISLNFLVSFSQFFWNFSKMLEKSSPFKKKKVFANSLFKSPVCAKLKKKIIPLFWASKMFSKLFWRFSLHKFFLIFLKILLIYLFHIFFKYPKNYPKNINFPQFRKNYLVLFFKYFKIFLKLI